MNEQQKTYPRFDIAQRIEHLILILSFTTLALTGIPQKFAQAGLSDAIIALLGGITTVRIIHRVAATLFILEAIYHAFIIGYKLIVLRLDPSMLPGIKDARDMLDFFLHNIGVKKEAPRMPRYNFTEKMEYWAMLWGLVLMGLTGFMLWNPIATTKILPGVFIPAAKVAHGWEAVLAVLAILIWHFYNVHLKRWNWAMIKGRLTHEEMEEEHGAELEQIENDQLLPLPALDVIKKRSRVYLPIASIVSLILVLVLFRFVTFEETAIKTIPPVDENVEIFSQQTPTPLSTQTSAGSTTAVDLANAGTWDAGIGDLFANRCSACHGSLGGLSLTTYNNAMVGSNNGAVILSGNAEDSPLVKLQEAGNHPGVFTTDELEIIKAWITAGAPEK
jgi:cytochrome b subunit of formate dehydrogenase/mono/diheme cytochrome c family protein